MKYLLPQLLYIFGDRPSGRNVRILLRFFLVLVAMITVYSVAFHFIMVLEDREFSWITGVYWTLTVMSTLGFGDITFTGDVGKLFSVFVLLSGIVFLLIILPFTFIQFFYAPWLESQSRARAPRELPQGTAGHVLLTHHDHISRHVAERLRQYNYHYVILVGDLARALELSDQDYAVMLGDLSDPEVYRRARVEQAGLVFAGVDDMVNTNITITVREVAPEVPIVANADLDESREILRMAGCTQDFQFMKMLGEALARRTLGPGAGANVIGRFEDLLIAEAVAMRTPLEGRSLRESRLREATGVTVLGLWERGRFEIPTPHTQIGAFTVLILGGSAEQLKRYDERYGSSQATNSPVLILGGGRVGRAAAEALQERQIDYRIVERNPRLAGDRERYIQGSAADINTLVRAGIRESPTVIITTHDDSTNIYLTIYCRRLRPDLQIISRANYDRNVATLHRAGADLVISYASMVANTVVNLLKRQELILTEGLRILRVDVPPELAGSSLAASRIRERTGCSVIGVEAEGRVAVNPEPAMVLRADHELILIGTDDAERSFLQAFGEKH